jgi:hypothetical protein
MVTSVSNIISIAGCSIRVQGEFVRQQEPAEQVKPLYFCGKASQHRREGCLRDRTVSLLEGLRFEAAPNSLKLLPVGMCFRTRARSVVLVQRFNNLHAVW